MNLTVCVGRVLQGVEHVVDRVLARLGYGRMYVRCSWCRPARIMGTKLCRSARAGQITDGMCEACFQAQLRENGLEAYVPPAPQLSVCLQHTVLACVVGTLAGVATMGGIALCVHYV